ncbi:MAG TPA: DUF1949 domain-containing protein, partial [Actinomycetales bacterium]|nr:DUF1949 domain-containing protein [Actinomycetales bacterium]
LASVPRARRSRSDLRAVTVGAADAGRVEAELRTRGFEVTDTEWAQEVTHVVAVEPGGAERLDGVLQAITHGEVLSADAGVAWTETPV